MSLRLQLKGFKELGFDLKKLAKESRTATQQALNRTATTVRSRSVKAVATQMGGAKVGEVRKSTDIKKASAASPKAQLIVREEGFGLEKLRKETKVRKVRKGTVKKGGERFKVTYKGKPIPGAFQLRGLKGGGGNVIFKRIGGKLKRLFGYSTFQEFQSRKGSAAASDVARKTAEERFPIEFRRAFENRLRRFNRK